MGRFGRRGLFLGLMLPCLVFLGCNHGPKMYQVKGTVHYKNGGVPPGAIRIVCFQPMGDTKAEVRKGATGELQSDGSFVLTTRVPRDGAYAGDYAVTFNFRKGETDSTPTVDPKYWRAATTPYKIKLDHDINDLALEVEPPK